MISSIEAKKLTGEKHAMAAVLAAILLGGLIGVAQHRTAERAQMLSCINATEATDTDAEVCEKISQHRRMIGR